ncbi:MAG: transglycosylase domain-containing protein, partial [Thermoleophilia bacterium]
STKRFYLMCALGSLGLVTLLAAAFGIQTVLAIIDDLPSVDDHDLSSLGQTSKIYAADGSLLAEVFGSENRTVVPLASIPKSLQDATIAIEDERFYEHSGVDLEAIGRAALRDVTHQELAEGGSTITQQLVKNVYVTDEPTFSRKIAEAYLATELENSVSKETILERYLNTIYYGENAYGVEAAAQTYFGKSVSELNLEECAVLAGLPNAPSASSPRQYPEEARSRRDIVIQKMADLGYISQEEADRVKQKPIVLSEVAGAIEAEPYFVEYVKEELVEKYGPEVLYEGGLRVYTTIEPELQNAGSAAIQATLYEEGDPAAAIVSIDPANGHIRAMVSSQDFASYKFNLAAQARRQPGSTFKPFVLTAAVEKGVNPKRTYYMSKQIDIPLPGGGSSIWSVHTYDFKYFGVSSIEEAMLRSDNTVFAQLVMDVGPDKTREAAQKLGIQSEMAANPSIALGGLGQGVSPLEMASAYATLAAGGMYNKPTAITRVELPNGEVDYIAAPTPRRVVSDGVAYVVTDVLRADIEKGTSSRANIGRPAGGKTGSTENLQDAWFVGYTPNLSTSVWIGYPDEQIPMTNVHGGSVWGGGFPATIWKDFMLAALKDVPAVDFPAPTEPVDFKRLQGTYVLFSGGDKPETTPRDDAYGEEGEDQEP